MHPKYVPVLKWRQGEYQALSRLDADTKRCIVPLLEVCPPEYDFETRQVAKTMNEHLAKFAHRVFTKWGTRPAFLDLRLIGATERMDSGEHPLTYLLDDVRRFGGSLIPVTSLRRDRDYQTAVAKAFRDDGHGVGIRFTLDDLGDADFNSQIGSLLISTGAKIDQADLMLDLGNGILDPVDDLSELLVDLLQGSEMCQGSRSLTLIGSAFPSSMAKITVPLQTVPRSEWSLYTSIVDNFSKYARDLMFGDYGIAARDLPQGDMRYLKPSATVRYTTNGSWLIAKGNTVRQDGGYDQFRSLCKSIVDSEQYLGSTFSRGSSYIDRCSRGHASTGNLSTWRWVGTNHHITKVQNDLANFYGT